MLRGFRRGEQPPAGEPEAEEPAAPPTDEGLATPPEADGLTAPFQAPLDDLAVAPSEPALAVPTEPAPAAEPPRTGRRTRRGWSLRAHLVTLVAIALALLVVAGVALTLRDYRVARDDTAGFGHYTSRLAAAELTATIPDIRGLMIRSGVSVGVITGGNLAALPPEKCNLSFSPFREFTAGTLRLVLADGTVICTSGGSQLSRSERPYAGASWLTPVFQNGSASVVGPMVDPITRHWVLFVSAPVISGGHVDGALTLALELKGLAPQLRQRLHGLHRFEVLVTDSHGSRIVSWSVNPGRWVGGHLLKSFAAANTRRGARIRDPDGKTRIFAGGDRVQGLGWRVYSGMPMSTVRASASAGLSARLFWLGLAAAVICGVALLGTVTVTRR